MLLRIHPENPNDREMARAEECLRKGGILVFPTDTIYALGCAASNSKGIEQICKIIGKKPEKANLSLLCHDLSHLSDFCTQISNHIFRVMRSHLPGPYTFILNANSNVPKIFKNSAKRTVGIRVPDNNIVQELIKRLDGPLVSTSIHSEDEIEDYLTDPELIHEKYENTVDYVIDGGAGGNEPSTVIDCTNDELVLIREGKGKIDW